MATARIQVEFLDPKDAQRRLAQIAQAEQRLNTQFKGGFITSEKLRKSTERLSRAKALLTRRLNTNSASLRRGTRAAATMTTTLGSLRSIVAGVGITFGLWQVTRIIGSALRTVGEFQKEMNRVRALTQATQVEFEALDRTIKKLGSTTQFTASQVAAGAAFLAQAGFKANEIVRAMPATLNLAAAASLDLATSADIVSNVMKGFRIDVGDLENAVDVLTTSFTSSNTNLVQLGQAMKKAGPVAKQLGFAFEEIVAVISVLGNAGIQAGEAGTALRRIMLNLIGDAQKFGITIRDTGDKMLPFIEILRNIEAAGLSDERMFELVGDRAAAAISVLTSGTVEVQAMVILLQALAVKTAELRRQMEEGLIGSTRELTSAWEGFTLAASDTGPLEAAQDALSGLLRTQTELFELNKEFAKEFPDFKRRDFSDVALGFFENVNSIKRRLLLDKEIAKGIAPPTAKDAAKKIFEENEALKTAIKEIEKQKKAAAEAARKRFIEEAGFNQKLIEIHQQKIKFFTKAEEEFVQEAKQRREELFQNKLAIDQREFERLVKKLKKEKAVAETIGNQEHDLAILRAQLAGDTVAAILLQEDKRLQETLAGLEKLGAGEEDLARARELLAAQTAVKVVQENQRAFEQMAQQIDLFFQRAALGAQSFSDLFKQIWTQLLSFFISQVSRMVAAWVLGQRTMQAASAGGGGGGGIGSILSGVFGGGGLGGIFGGATAPGGTGTFSGAPIGSNLVSGGGGLASFRVPGIGISTGLPPAPAGSASGIAAQQSVFAALALDPVSLAILAIIAAGMFGLQKAAQGSVVGGVLGGAALGGIAGAILGGLFGAFRRGKLKRRAAASEEAFSAQLIEVVAEFKRFELDFENALDTVDQLFADFSQVAPQQFGKFGRRAVNNITPFVGAVKNRIREIQVARDARLLLSAGSLIPEFAHGGLVGALLHPGEFVIRREAVQQVGVQNLERINRGDAALEGSEQFIVQMIFPGVTDSRGFEQALRRNRGTVIRIVRQAARDQGLRRPV